MEAQRAAAPPTAAQPEVEVEEEEEEEEEEEGGAASLMADGLNRGDPTSLGVHSTQQHADRGSEQGTDVESAG
ncbi:hypothetical protein EYF80_060181 [Liparis tanakae]|uniref:Uncharacterized protein n=1 Tax=Liparis tanakae TaxID=230148 RepID=A0A4Z2EM76_9TELE|nr:hypothetical protein EYF80_060181 [Liparis tanakae]